MKKIFNILAIALVLTFSAPAFAFADSAGYETNWYDVNVSITEDHVCQVQETIKVNFTESRHGIYRYIPYEPGIYVIKKVKVPGENYEISSEYSNNWNQIIQIGDADKVVRGNHTYNVNYNILCYKDEDPDKDYLSIDLIPTGWSTSIKTSKVTVKLPKAVDPASLKLYGGAYGSTGQAQVKSSYNEKTNEITIAAKNLPKGYGITLGAELPEGYWVDPANREWFYKPLIAVLVVIPALMLLLWFVLGRDPRVVKTVEFYPPEGMTPADLGYVIDGKVDYKDVISLIMYLADKGYIQIDEYKKNKFRLKKLKDIDPNEKSFVKTFFRGLFDRGNSVKTDDLPAGFGSDFQTAQQQVKDHYRGKNALYTTSSEVCRIVGMILMFMPPIISIIISAAAKFNDLAFFAIIPVAVLLVLSMVNIIRLFDKWESTSKAKRNSKLVFALIFALAGVLIAAVITTKLMESIALGALVVASTAVTFIFVILMKKRTEKSARLLGQILGFRDFIETAELDKLNALVEEDPAYFYNIMPYAYVMGLSDKWAKKFEHIKIDQPEWYNGYDSMPMYNMLWYSHMMNSCTKSVESNVISSIASAASDSGGGSIGGGFGGGGLSGGGFGGGGGGSW